MKIVHPCEMGRLTDGTQGNPFDETGLGQMRWRFSLYFYPVVILEVRLDRLDAAGLL